MRIQLIFFIAIFLAMNAFSQSSDTLYVNLTSHKAKSFDLSSVRRLTFTETEMTVVKNNNTQVKTNFSEIESLTFNRKYDELGGIKETNFAKILVYPNPTTGQLTINNEQLTIVNERTTIENIEIFDIFGSRLTPNPSPFWRGAGGEVNISHLPSGIYFLKINNQTFKIIKN